MKALGCSQDFSHYKSMGIFPDAQGQLTPQSLVRSGRISNSSEMLWMSSLPASMKKIRSKIEAIECSQYYTSIFQMRKGRVGGGIWPKFEHIQAFMHVTCKNEDDRQAFPHYKSMRIFPDAQGQLTPQSLGRSGRISNSTEMLWMLSLPTSMKKIRSKMKALECSQHFPHYNPMGAILCHGHQSFDPIWPKT